MNAPVATANLITADTPESKLQPNRYVVEGNCLAAIEQAETATLERSKFDFTMMLDDPEKNLTPDAHAMALAIRDAITAELDSRFATVKK